MNDTTARQNLFAGIVTFNPDIELLRKNIEAICAQVDLVIIVDNGSRNLEDIRPLADAHHCKLIPNAQNEGIATALNQIALWLFLDAHLGSRLGMSSRFLFDAFTVFLNEFQNRYRCSSYTRS